MVAHARIEGSATGLSCTIARRSSFRLPVAENGKASPRRVLVGEPGHEDRETYDSSVRTCVAIAVVAAGLAGCGSSNGVPPTGEPRSEVASAASRARIERCVDRLLSRARLDDEDEESTREYARRTYCARFERNGWIYSDGALSVAAQMWLEAGGTCATASTGKPVRTVPCEDVGARLRTLDCALLHHVRRSEVRKYLAQLERKRPVECDDGTPLDELGVP